MTKGDHSQLFDVAIDASEIGIINGESPLASHQQTSSSFQLFSNWRYDKRLFSYSIASCLVSISSLIYGTLIGNLSLISLGFMCFFSCLSGAICMFSGAFKYFPPSGRFPFGYSRFETLASFSNGAFLIFVSLFLIFESGEKLFIPEHDDTGDYFEQEKFVIHFAVLCFLVNLGGIAFCTNWLQMWREEGGDHHHYPDKQQSVLPTTSLPSTNPTIIRREIMRSAVSRALLDFGISACAIGSNYLGSLGWKNPADPVAALLIVSEMLHTALPVCISTGRILLQTTPLSCKTPLDRSLREMGKVPSECPPTWSSECLRSNFWTQSPGVFVGNLTVRISDDAQESEIRKRIMSLFSPHIHHLTVQIEKEGAFN